MEPPLPCRMGLRAVAEVAVEAEVAGGEPAPSLWSVSRYAPNPLDVDHSFALSAAVPSPHSLKVVTSCHGAFDATMSRTFCDQRARSRVKRGLDSSAFQKPGLIEYE